MNQIKIKLIEQQQPLTNLGSAFAWLNDYWLACRQSLSRRHSCSAPLPSGYCSHFSCLDWFQLSRVIEFFFSSHLTKQGQKCWHQLRVSANISLTRQICIHFSTKTTPNEMLQEFDPTRGFSILSCSDPIPILFWRDLINGL